MSNKVAERCWPLQMPMAAKGVLMAMADWADDEGHCWPALESISERTCASRRCVIEAIKWLEETGVLVTDRSNGRHTKYQLWPEKFVAPAGASLRRRRTKPASQPVQIRHEPVQIRHGEPGVTSADPAEGNAYSARVPVQIRQTPVQIRHESLPNLHTNHQEPPKEPSTEPSGNGHPVQMVIGDSGLAEEPKKSKRKSGSVIDDFPDLLAGVDLQVLADWQLLRKAKRAPVSRTVLTDLRTEAAKAGLSMQEAMVMCVAANWQGFQADWALRRLTGMDRTDRRLQTAGLMTGSAHQLGGKAAPPRVFDNVDYGEFPDGRIPA